MFAHLHTQSAHAPDVHHCAGGSVCFVRDTSGSMRNGRDHEGEAARKPASGADALDATSSALTLATDWRTGPRTRAWDDLWRRLLAGLAGTPEASGADAPRVDVPAVRSGGEGTGNS